MNFIKIIDIYVIVQCLIFGFMIVQKNNTNFQIIGEVGCVTILWFIIKGINVFHSIRYTMLILSVGVSGKVLYYILRYIWKKIRGIANGKKNKLYKI
nr:hypothetical protein [Clostridium paraputrificum]